MQIFWLFFLLSNITVLYADPDSKIFKTATFPKCERSPPCHNTTFLSYNVPIQHILVNPKKKILMEISPKSSCTNAVVMFFDNMGYKFGEHYTGWPHDFRFNYYFPECSVVTPCMFSDPSWTRFKVVRNPFTRAVSSYIHCMRKDLLLNSLFKGNATEQDLFTFEDFAYWISILHSRDALFSLAGAHFKVQAMSYEMEYFRQNNHQSLFHIIVKAEDAEPAIERLNKLTNETFNWNLEGSEHNIVNKTNVIQHYVGNLTWAEIKDRIPSDYHFFYNQYSRRHVKEVYHWDLHLYNYSYPFDSTFHSRAPRPFAFFHRL
jgi:hypothetical protein